MFLEKEDLGNVIYEYQLDQITDGNDDIVIQGIAAAIEEAKSYLTANVNSKAWLDGRILYDVDAIFGATALDRNSLILQHCATLAKWHIAQLCNADFIYEKAKDRYDRAIDWFNKIAKGTINLTSLPQLVRTEENTNKQPFEFGSRTKFNHDY
jgi:phage gp36-like protein